MRHLIALGTAALLSLTAIPAAQAQSPAPCPQGGCTQQQQQDAHHGKAKGQDASQTHRSQAQPQQGETQPKGQQSQSHASQTHQKAAPANAASAKPQANSAARHKALPAPHVGDSARGAQRFERAAHSRLKAPPKGEEYRVVNGHLVLVNSNTLRIISDVGLLSSLLN